MPIKVEVKVYQGENPVASANTLLDEFLIEGLRSEKPGEPPSITVRFDFDSNGMLHVSALDKTSGTQKSVSVHATQARLTPHQIIEARRQMLDLETSDEDDEPFIIDSPMIDDETMSLLNRAHTLLDEGSVSDADNVRLRNLVQSTANASTQGELDDLAEQLLDVLFDLE